MLLRSWRIYVLLALVIAGALLLSVFWEFYLEDLIGPYIYAHYHPDLMEERIEFIFVSVISATIALIVPGWMLIQRTRQSERAMQELGKAHEVLETRVQQRTVELENTNHKLVLALKRQTMAEEVLRRTVSDLKLLSSRLLVLQEDEKKQFASELHDSVSQTLSALKFRFEHILSQVRGGKTEITADIHNTLLPSIQGAIEDVRNIYMELRPTLLDDFGLIATLNWLSGEFRKKFPDIHVASDIAVVESEIPESLKIVIFRLLQEGLNNIARHSQATAAHYSLTRNESGLDLVLQDDGIGFDIAEVQFGDDARRATGLSSMRARVEQTHGSFQIETDKGAGVLIRAAWPLRDLKAA